jgi:hypothetical protein
MLPSNRPARAARLIAVAASAVLLAACGAGSSTPPSASATTTAAPRSSASGSPVGPVTPDQPSESPTTSQAPEGGGGTSSGDIPDNAVFLSYQGTNPAFTIQYVEGWQVTPQPDGVVIRDKDSSETVAVVAPQADVASYVSTTDLPALRAQAGFALAKQDTVKVGTSSYVHLVFHLPAPPDPVTGKQVPSTVDRYYVPGVNGLAVVSLSTPDGVDNVDAFRQMIESFRWQ